MTWKFKSGSVVSFSHMENDEDYMSWLGAGIPLICFDELSTFLASQFWFMFGSNRSTCGVRPYVRATTNPEAKSWVADLIQWWWDETSGYPILERSGKIRWFVRIKDRLEWADDPKTLKEQWPEMVPKSLTFIPSRVFDNKILMEKDPGYLSNLMALSYVERERYLYGNWKIDSSAGKLFKREWFKILPEQPSGLTQFVRYWDLAASEKKKHRDPDFTAGVLMSIKDGQWIVCDLQHFRGTPKDVESRIAQTAQTDPGGTKIRMEQEGGASGLIVVDHYARNVLRGFDFKGVPSIKNKVARAGPLSSAAQSNNVILIRAPWNIAFLDEHENFKGLDEHNDIVDAATGAMAELKASSGEWKFAAPTQVGRYDPISSIPSTGTYKPIGL